MTIDIEPILDDDDNEFCSEGCRAYVAEHGLPANWSEKYANTCPGCDGPLEGEPVSESELLEYAMETDREFWGVY